jgi:hypothetical protein
MPSGQLAAMSGRIIQKYLETQLQLLCGFHCHGAGSDLATDHLFGSLKQHLAGCRVPVRDCSRLTRDRFLLRKDFKTRASIIQMHPCAGWLFLKIMIRQWNKWTIYKLVMTVHLSFMTCTTLCIEQPSYMPLQTSDQKHHQQVCHSTAWPDLRIHSYKAS